MRGRRVDRERKTEEKVEGRKGRTKRKEKREPTLLMHVILCPHLKELWTCQVPFLWEREGLWE